MHCSRNASHLPKTSPGPLACYCKQRYTICTVRPTQFPGAPNNTVTGARTPTVFNGTQIPIYQAVRITHTLPLMRHPERSDEGTKSKDLRIFGNYSVKLVRRSLHSLTLSRDDATKTA